MMYVYVVRMYYDVVMTTIIRESVDSLCRDGTDTPIV